MDVTDGLNCSALMSDSAFLEATKEAFVHYLDDSVLVVDADQVVVFIINCTEEESLRLRTLVSSHVKRDTTHINLGFNITVATSNASEVASALTSGEGDLAGELNNSLAPILGSPVAVADTAVVDIVPGPAPSPSPSPPMQVEPGTSGDPHAMNAFGEKFDIFQEGFVTLLRVPRKPTSTKKTILTIGANIVRVVPEACDAAYVRAVVFEGSSLGHKSVLIDVGDLRHLATPFTIMVGAGIPEEYSEGRTIMLTSGANITSFEDRADQVQKAVEGHSWGQGPAFLLAVDSARIIVRKVSRPGLGLHYLNVDVANLSRFGKDIGGLLGLDDHSDQQHWRDKCEAEQAKGIVDSALTGRSTLIARF